MLNRQTLFRQCQVAARKKRGGCTSLFRKERRWFARCRCQAGHQWAQRAYSLLRGQWCWDCDHSSPKATVDYMKKLATSKGGRFLSKRWRGTGTKHKWGCALGHIWNATPNSITQGRWCPECSDRLSERICRAYFEQIFHTPFRPAWPEWLTNSRGQRMELDGFSKRLALAFEFQGVQHYKPSRFFHQGNRTFKIQRADDLRKHRLCRAHGVRLIHVPHTIKPENYLKLIRDECRHKGARFPKIPRAFRVDLRKASSPNTLSRLQKVAAKKGGRLLAGSYLGSTAALLWRCKKHHSWKASPSSILSGSWCPVCAKKAR